MATVKAGTAAEAHKLKLYAERLRLNVRDCPEDNPVSNRFDLRQADAFDAAAVDFLTLPKSVERGTGGELCPPPGRGKPGIECAVKEPDRVSLEASIQRVQLIDECGAFDLGFDAAETIRPKDATEQMLAHQMAVVHKRALELLAKSAAHHDTIEEARLANSAARLMDTYQRAMLTLNRIRNGGRQLVTVQHVQVSEGGQAVIAGAMNAGGQLDGGESEK